MSAAVKNSDATAPGTLGELLRDIERLDGLTADWDEQQQRILQARDHAIAALHREALLRLLRRLRMVDSAREALREAATDEVIYTVLRQLGLLKPSLEERVRAALDSVRPMLQRHQGDVTLLAVEPPEVSVRLLGSCQGCPSSELTLSLGIEKAIKENCPEITRIRNVRGSIDPERAAITSPFAVTRPWLKVMRSETLHDGEVHFVQLPEHRLLLYRSGDRLKCYADACAHLGASLQEGRVHQGRITCPRHGFEYELDSGECLTVPEVQLQAHACRSAHGWIEVQPA
jgi:Fe-S cluster biogenesis protein NfuA/nitrite reductase/ring-hydroxylating ferredoxin subunit